MGGTPGSTKIVVKSPLVTNGGAVTIGAYFLCLIIYYLAMSATTIGNPPAVREGFLFGGGLIVIGVMFAIFARTHVRRVELDPQGVTFVYFLRNDRGDWDHLIPGVFPASMGRWIVNCWYSAPTSPTGRLHRRHSLGVTQGRALVMYPKQPPWNVSEGVTRSLGIEPPVHPIRW